MHSKRLALFICFVTFLFACTSKTPTVRKASIRDLKYHIPNIVQVQQFGDTLRLEVDKQGNMFIKHYIDLKGTQGDNFNNSYNVECYYERRDLDSTILIESKKIEIKAVLIENYKTEFSGGKNFYFITRKGDTVFNAHFLDYIK